MTDQTTENFLQAWSNFEWPNYVTPSYRLYYNEDGSPNCYSMDALPYKYVEVDAETFALRPWNVRVIEGKLTYIQQPVQVKKLQPVRSELGTACHPQDVCVIVSKEKPNITWKETTNEIS